MVESTPSVTVPERFTHRSNGTGRLLLRCTNGRSRWQLFGKSSCQRSFCLRVSGAVAPSAPSAWFATRSLPLTPHCSTNTSVTGTQQFNSPRGTIAYSKRPCGIVIKSVTPRVGPLLFLHCAFAMRSIGRKLGAIVDTDPKLLNSDHITIDAIGAPALSLRYWATEKWSAWGCVSRIHCTAEPYSPT